MKTYLKLSLTAMTIVLFSSGQALAGHGGGGGGGFHGGGGGGGYHGGASYGGGGYHGGASYGGGYHGGEANWSAAGHTPSFNSPHSNFNPSRSNLAPGAWSHNAAHPATGERSNIGGRTNYASNTGRGPHPGPHPDWYHGNWNNHGNHQWHNWPAGWWGAGWWGAGLVAGAELADFTTPWSWGYLSYNNPYCTAPVVVDDTTIDYSQPIVLATAPATDLSEPSGDVADEWPVTTPRTPADQAAQLLDAARIAFAQGDYAAALTQCDKAVAKTPNDVVLHEFRGLTLFALHRYKEAAAALYAVLSVGPGWDWTTMSSLYPDANVYTEQLRALERYVGANPNSADARFVLAYEYMTCQHADAAAAQFKAVVQLNPKDKLSADILSALVTTDAAKQPVSTAPVSTAPAKPVAAATLVGNWKANRTDGKTVSLNLADNGKYTWTFAQKDKPQEFSGDYSVADNLLILKQAGTPVMVGQVTPMAANRFNFKLPGNNPNDPGLTFGK